VSSGSENKEENPKKEKENTAARRRTVVLILLVVVLAVVCGLKFAERYTNSRKYADMTETPAPETTAVIATEAETTAPETTASEPAQTAEADFLKKIDFTALKERNSDVAAWLYIPGTDPEISYPVMWKKNDNDYYLHRDIDQKTSYEGVFLDGADKPDFSSVQNLIYGHHMKNGTMFAGLAKFKEEDYFKEHRTLYLYTPEKTYRLRTFSCAYTDAAAERRKTVFADRTEFDAYVDLMTKDCTFREIPAGGFDQLFAFVTCSYEYQNARTILYCYEADQDGKPVSETSVWDGKTTETTASASKTGTDAGT